jgi:hypothetical protein
MGHRIAFLAALAAVSLAACDTSQLGGSGGIGKAKTVEYQVTGAAKTASMTYQNDSGDSSQEGNQSIPYSKTVTIKGGGFAYISAQNDGATGNVTCTIIVDGVQKESNTSSGPYSICQASGTV